MNTITPRELIMLRIEPITKAVRDWYLACKAKSIQRHIDVVRKNQDNDRAVMRHLLTELMHVQMRRRK